uniref:Uncharacterized protein n=1 Tax=Anguilla anguilla TaxID=7936 RepID=A0A0E9QV76_ANGAN
MNRSVSCGLVTGAVV